MLEVIDRLGVFEGIDVMNSLPNDVGATKISELKFSSVYVK